MLKNKFASLLVLRALSLIMTVSAVSGAYAETPKEPVHEGASPTAPHKHVEGDGHPEDEKNTDHDHEKDADHVHSDAETDKSHDDEHKDAGENHGH